jgi:hypothetical protein
MVLANLYQLRRYGPGTMNSDTRIAESAACDATADRNSLLWLALGALVGIGLGCLSALGWIGSEQLPKTVVARVNDIDIRLVEYERALALFASEKREPINERDRALILERMIEEELLVQEGIASGLIRDDRTVRTTVLRSMLAGIVVELEANAEAIPDDSKNIGASAAIDVGKTTDTHSASRHAVFGDYLEQLRSAATIRSAEKGRSP